MTITAAILDMESPAQEDHDQPAYGAAHYASHFLQEALHSAQRRLALSTAARLMLARDKRLAQTCSSPSTYLRAPQGSAQRPAAHSTQDLKDIQLSPEALKRIRLECQISDLRRSLQHIEASALPHRTKRVVGRSIEEQLIALQERHAALCHAAAV